MPGNLSKGTVIGRRTRHPVGVNTQRVRLTEATDRLGKGHLCL